RVEELLRAAFVFALADIREVAPVRRAAGVLVEEDGDGELFADALSEAAGKLDAVVHRDVRDRNERDDVDRADARMRPAMRRHVDQLDALPDEAEGSLEHRVGLADEGD